MLVINSRFEITHVQKEIRKNNLSFNIIRGGENNASAINI